MDNYVGDIDMLRWREIANFRTPWMSYIYYMYILDVIWYVICMYIAKIDFGSHMGHTTK